MADNATPANTSTPEWMHFVNFDGRLTGATAQVVKQVAAARGISPTDLLDEILSKALVDQLSPHAVKADDVKVEPMTINTGNGGFHVLTFVTDGYGNLVAENAAGEELARTEWVTEDDETDTHDEFRQLAGQAFRRQAAPTTD